MPCPAAGSWMLAVVSAIMGLLFLGQKKKKRSEAVWRCLIYRRIISLIPRPLFPGQSRRRARAVRHLGGEKLSHVSSWQAIIDAAVPSRRAWTLAGRDRHHVARNAAVVAPKRRWAASSPTKQHAVPACSTRRHGGADWVGLGGLRGLAALLRG